MLHIRLRKGSANTQKGMLRFIDELIARVERAGATGVKLLRADSGFWNTRVFKRLEKAGWQYSIAVRMTKTVRVLVEQIDEDAWTRVADYPKDGEAQIAETVYGARRLIVRRTRLLGAQAELFPDWRHFPIVTNRTDELALVEAEHRDHAVIEQVIADLKDQALAHFPSGPFTPTAPGPCSARSRTTCSAGPSSSASRTRPSAPRARCAADCSRSPAASTRTRRALDLASARPLALARRLHRALLGSARCPPPDHRRRPSTTTSPTPSPAYRRDQRCPQPRAGRRHAAQHASISPRPPHRTPTAPQTPRQPPITAPSPPGSVDQG